RIFARNSNRARIEIFLLQPHQTDHLSALSMKGSSRWECMVGNSKKWKSSELLKLDNSSYSVIVERLEDNVVEFRMNTDVSFAEVLSDIGHIPLPPYIKHLAEEYDKDRYQTVFAEVQGSVAAPTAALHFTD